MRERRVIANLVLTLDGRTTGPGGPMDMSCIAPHGVSDQARDGLVQMTEATTVLLGRNNYQGFASYWPQVARDQNAEPRDAAFARWLDDVEKVVFSRTLTTLEWTNSRLAEGEPATVVRALRAEQGGDIRVLSSQSLIRQLLAADELDRFELTLAPTIAGGGARLFDGSLPASDWIVSDLMRTDSGAVRLAYDRAR